MDLKSMSFFVATAEAGSFSARFALGTYTGKMI